VEPERLPVIRQTPGLGGTAQGAGASLRHLGRGVRPCVCNAQHPAAGAGYWGIKAAVHTVRKTPRSAHRPPLARPRSEPPPSAAPLFRVLIGAEQVQRDMARLADHPAVVRHRRDEARL